MALGEAFITIRADTSEFTADLEKLKAEVAATQFNIGVRPSGAASSAGTVTTAFTSEGSDEVVADAQRVADAVVASDAEQEASNDALKASIDELVLKYGELDLARDSATGGIKDAETAVDGLGAAVENLFSHTNSPGAALVNIGKVFAELPAPAQLGLLTVALGAVEAAGIGVITGISAAVDAALAKVGVTAAGTIEDTRNELSAAFGTSEGSALSSSLLQLSDSSGIAEAALGQVVTQLGNLGLGASEAQGITDAFANSIDAVGLHGNAANTALTGLEKAFEGVAKQTSAFSVSNIDSFTQIDGALSKTAIVAQLVADGVGKNADAVEKLIAAGKVTTTQGLTAVTQVAAAAPQTATPSFGGIADAAKNSISNALGEAFDNPALLAQVQKFANDVVADVKKIAPQIEAGFSDFVGFIQKILPDAFDILQKGTQEAIDLINRFGPDIAGLVADTKEFFDDVTTQGTAANGVLQGFEGAIEIVVAAFKIAYPVIQEVGSILGIVGDAIKLVADLLTGNLAGALNDLEGIFANFADIVINSFTAVLHAVADVADTISHVPGFGWLHDLGDAANGAASDLDGIKASIDAIPTNKTVNIEITTTLNSAAGNGVNNLGEGLSGAQADRAGGSADAADAALGVTSQQLSNNNVNDANTAAFQAAQSLKNALAGIGGATSGSGGSGGAGGAANTAANALAAATQTFHAALSTFDTAIGGAQTVAAVDSAFATLQTAIDTEDKALGKTEPTGLKTYLAKQQAALEKSASEVQLGLSTRTQFLADATVAVANPNIAGAQGIITQLQGQVANSLEFAADLKQLQKEGLNQTALNQLLAVGPTSAGLQAANDLIHATAAQITTINSLQTQAGTSGETLGTTLASGFQTAGAQAAEGLIDGLKSALPALETQMHALAETMDATIKADLGIHSPSTVFAQHGRDIVAGLAAGIAGSSTPVVPIPTLGRAGAGAAGGMVNTFNIEINGDLKNPAATASTIGNGIADVLLSRQLATALAG